MLSIILRTKWTVLLKHMNSDKIEVEIVAKEYYDTNFFAI